MCGKVGYDWGIGNRCRCGVEMWESLRIRVQKETGSHKIGVKAQPPKTPKPMQTST